MEKYITELESLKQKEREVAKKNEKKSFDAWRNAVNEFLEKERLAQSRLNSQKAMDKINETTVGDLLAYLSCSTDESIEDEIASFLNEKKIESENHYKEVKAVRDFEDILITKK